MRVSRIHALWALCALGGLPLACSAGEGSVDRKVNVTVKLSDAVCAVCATPPT